MEREFNFLLLILMAKGSNSKSISLFQIFSELKREAIKKTSKERGDSNLPEPEKLRFWLQFL